MTNPTILTALYTPLKNYFDIPNVASPNVAFVGAFSNFVGYDN